MLFRFAYRGLRELSPRISYKALRLWVWKGLFALRAHKKRLKRNEFFPPFLFYAITNACNLRCRGCWISSHGKPDTLSLEAVDHAIGEGTKRSVYFHTLLGGEPLMHPDIWQMIERHPECYFQVITNGRFLGPENADRIRKLGNISPLISIDGNEPGNDRRRGEGAYKDAIAACEEMKKRKILYGVATVITAENMDEVLTEEYVRKFIDLGAMYLWYYIFRPVGLDPAPELCISPERMTELKKRMMKLRRKMPIILIDTYWTSKGEAVCPVAKGLSVHIGPKGSIEPCPPLSIAKEYLEDNQGDLFKTVNESEFLRNFQNFVRETFGGEENGQGCVILSHPKELARFLREQGCADVSGRKFLEELEASEPKSSHHLPGEEIPEDFWLYRMLKKTLFFGMGAYG